MPVATQCFNIVRGKVMRVTALDECCSIHVGSPPACEVAVSDGLISVAMTAEIEAGEEIRDRNWAGALCVVDRSPDEFVRWTLEFTFCQVDPSMVTLLTGAPVELGGVGGLEAVGFRSRQGRIETKAAVELWSGTSPVECGPGETPSYGYTLLPCVVGGAIGDLTIENGRADFTVSGAFTQGGGGWGVGPYDVISTGGLPSPLADPMQTDEHHLLRLTDVAPPEAACECLSLEEAGGTRPTS
jgi:hypothetical protein